MNHQTYVQGDNKKRGRIAGTNDDKTHLFTLGVLGNAVLFADLFQLFALLRNVELLGLLGGLVIEHDEMAAANLEARKVIARILKGTLDINEEEKKRRRTLASKMSS